MKKLLRTFGIAIFAIVAASNVAACRQSFVSKTNESTAPSVWHSDHSKKLDLRSEQPPYRFSMYPIYDNETESLVYFHIETLNDKRFVQDAKVVAFFLGPDGDPQKKIFKLAPDKKRYVTSLPLKHHESYNAQTFVEFPDKSKFSPIFAFHCADPLPEVDWLNSEEGKEK
jgi:hypothetical protein